MASLQHKQFDRRAQRVRSKLRKIGDGKPRLSVMRSSKHISVQVIDDGKGVTLAAVSSLEPELKSQLGKGTGNLQAAKLVGATLAERAKTAGIGKVVFDRGGYVYHGKVKALAEAAREKGLDF